jgi:hypothetical protein
MLDIGNRAKPDPAIRERVTFSSMVSRFLVGAPVNTGVRCLVGNTNDHNAQTSFVTLWRSAVGGQRSALRGRRSGSRIGARESPVSKISWPSPESRVSQPPGRDPGSRSAAGY